MEVGSAVVDVKEDAETQMFVEVDVVSQGSLWYIYTTDFSFISRIVLQYVVYDTSCNFYNNKNKYIFLVVIMLFTDDAKSLF